LKLFKVNRDEIAELRAVVEVRWVLEALLAIARKLKPLRAVSRTLTRRAKAAQAMREHSLSGQGRPQSVALSGGIAGRWTVDCYQPGRARCLSWR
jgi:hypothetical protein